MVLLCLNHSALNPYNKLVNPSGKNITEKPLEQIVCFVLRLKKLRAASWLIDVRRLAHSQRANCLSHSAKSRGRLDVVL
jgi:hypothetical protein